jgi:hypothetical protein
MYSACAESSSLMIRFPYAAFTVMVPGCENEHHDDD